MTPKPRLRILKPESIAAALAKAAELRLHYESDVAESICRDVLAIHPEHQEALVRLILCITDQFRDGRRTVDHARRLVFSLHSEYDRLYYLGVIFERWGRSLNRRGEPDAVALEWFVLAMRAFDKAAALSQPHNEEALMRWNACFRSCRADESLQARFNALWGMS